MTGRGLSVSHTWERVIGQNGHGRSQQGASGAKFPKQRKALSWLCGDSCCLGLALLAP